MTTIAIVTPYAFPETGASSIRCHAFAQSLAAKGYTPIIFAPAKKEYAQSTQERGVRVVRFLRKRNLFSLFHSYEVRVVIASTPPADLGLVALLAGVVNGCPTIADIRDPWVFDKKAVGLIHVRSFKFFVQKHMEAIFYRLARRKVVVTDWTRRLFEKELRIPARDFGLIPNGVQTSFFHGKRKERSQVRKELGIHPRTPLFVFQGSVWRDIPELIRHLTPLLSTRKAHLLIVGNVDQQSSQRFLDGIQHAITSQGLMKVVTCVFNVKAEDIPKYLYASDVGLNTVSDSLFYSTPVKTYEYAFAGLPVLSKGPAEGALADFHASNLQAGYYCFSWEDFEVKSEQIIKSLPSQKKKALMDSIQVGNLFSREKGGEEMVQIVKELVGQ